MFLIYHYYRVGGPQKLCQSASGITKEFLTLLGLKLSLAQEAALVAWKDCLMPS